MGWHIRPVAFAALRQLVRGQRPMRHFKRLARAKTFRRGHTLIRNLRQGLSDVTARVFVRLRLAITWAAPTGCRAK